MHYLRYQPRVTFHCLTAFYEIPWERKGSVDTPCLCAEKGMHTNKKKCDQQWTATFYHDDPSSGAIPVAVNHIKTTNIRINDEKPKVRDKSTE